MNAADVKNAVREMLTRTYPEWGIHVNRTPRRFTRPAFLLQSPKVAREDVNRSTIKESCQIRITCLVQQGAPGESDADALDAMRQEVLDLFRPGYLEVAGRTVGLDSLEGSTDFDRAWVDLQVTYLTERDLAPERLPLMEEVDTTTHI